MERSRSEHLDLRGVVRAGVEQEGTTAESVIQEMVTERGPRHHHLELG